MDKSANLSSPKILVLILSARQSPWGLIERFGQVSTFAKSDSENFQFLWYRGDDSLEPSTKLKFAGNLLDLWYKFVVQMNRFGFKGPSGFPGVRAISKYLEQQSSNRFIKYGAKLKDRKLLLPLPEFNSFIGLKTELAFEYCLQNFEFDYLVRTNSSSYLDTRRMLSYLENTPRESYVSGYKGDFFGEEFVSGASYILSKDVVEKITHQSQYSWQHHVVDDVAISRVIRSENIAQPTYFDRATLDSSSQVETLLRGTNNCVFHYRCKTGSVNETIQIMKHIDMKLSINN